MNEFHDDEIINQFVIESLDLIGTAVEPDLLVLERDGRGFPRQLLPIFFR